MWVQEEEQQQLQQQREREKEQQRPEQDRRVQDSGIDTEHLALNELYDEPEQQQKAQEQGAGAGAGAAAAIEVTGAAEAGVEAAGASAKGAGVDHKWVAAVQHPFENDRFRYTFSDDDKSDDDKTKKWRTKIRVPVSAKRRKVCKKKARTKPYARSSDGIELVDRQILHIMVFVTDGFRIAQEDRRHANIQS